MSRLREIFGIDVRSLAVLRVALGAVIVVDHLFRARFLGFDYTDAGYVPRLLVGEPPPFFGLHLANGSLEWQMALFGLGTALGVLLMVGWRTRVVTVLAWLVVGSLQYRNQYLLDAGDQLLRTLLLWSAFLPLGARYSLDARAGRGGGPRSGVVSSLASAALLLQLLFLYVHAGVLKDGPAWRSEGTAVAMVLGQSYWAGVANELFLKFPALLAWMTPITVWFETLGPLLLFSPWANGPMRVIGILAFWGFQAGLALGIQLHLFPFISSLGTLAFLPTWLWERLGFGGPEAAAAPAEAQPVRPAWLDRAATALLAVLFGLGVFQWIDGLGLVRAREASDRILAATGLLQRWSMYAPHPVPFDPAFTLQATYAGGETADALSKPGDATWERVRRMHDTYRFKGFWEKNMVAPGQAVRTRIYLFWLCEQWNRGAPPDDRMEAVELILRRTWLAGPQRGQTGTARLGQPQRCEPAGRMLEVIP